MDKVILIREEFGIMPIIVSTKEQALEICREKSAQDEIYFAAHQWERHFATPRKIYLDVPVGGPPPHYQDYVLYSPDRPDDWSYPPWKDVPPLTTEELVLATDPDCTPDEEEAQ